MNDKIRGITGVENDVAYKKEVIPYFSFEDTNYDHYTSTLS